MAVTIIPNVTNWSVTPQNGQVGYFTLMNTWLSESTSVIASLHTAITAQNTANAEVNALAIQTENNAIIATSLANYQGGWSDLVTYDKGQSVSSGTLYYISKVDSNLNHIVTDTNYWLPNPINDKLNKDFSTFGEESTPIDTDILPIMKADKILKFLSWANIKATLKTYFDTLYTVASSETTSGIIKLATSAEAQYGTDDLRAITPLKLRNALNASGIAPVYAGRAKVVFNGTGTVAIKSSGNISSITDNGLGNYRVNSTVTLPVDYNCQVSCDRVSATTSDPTFINYYNKQANYIDIYTTTGDRGTMRDVSDISVLLS